VKVLVCGGLGFIGLNFVRLLAEKRPDWSITVLDKLTYAANHPSLLPSTGKVTLVKGDICDRELVDKLVNQSDAVVNFAAETHNDNSIAEPVLFFETNLTGTLSLAEACRQHQTRLHHISTDEVFGDMPIVSEEKFTAESPYRPSSPYSASKASADLLLRAWFRTFGLPVTISNCTNNFGEFQHLEKLIPSTVRRITAGLNPKIYGDGTNIRDWIDVKDHCLGILAALESGVPGETYLFGAGDEVSNLDLAKALLDASGRKDLDVEFVEDRPGHDKRYALDWSKAKNELGWEPVEPKVLEAAPSLVKMYASR
jgi:dTDP-glucose 4,6-dehydratase